MNAVEVQDLSFSYGHRPVFSHVSFQVKSGEIFCLVGPNGCGKSTLLRCILGHLQPQAGEIRIGGKLLAEYRAPTLADQLAYVPQSHTRAFPFRTVDVVGPWGQIRKGGLFAGQTGQTRRAMAVLEQLHLAHLAETEYTSLSGGELQMVLLARALCQDSETLVLDEPAAHLDLGRTHDLLSVLQKIAREQGKTILLSTHDCNHALQLEDSGATVRMALMEQGQLSPGDTPLMLLRSDCMKQLYGMESRVVTVPDAWRAPFSGYLEGRRTHMTRWLRMTAAMLLLVILFTACGAPAVPATKSVTGETFTDCAGREVPIPDSTERIACLYAYTGHVAVLLGCEEQIAAVVDGLKRDALMQQKVPDIDEKHAI